jgi:hypothetical protein
MSTSDEISSTTPRVINDKIENIRNKKYYFKILEQLKIKGLLPLVQDILNEDREINYILLTVKVIDFLQQNKKIFKSFTQNTFENILLISIDEILRVHDIPLKEEELELIMTLLRNSFLIKKAGVFIRDLWLKFYYATQKKCKGCRSGLSVDVITDVNKPPRLPTITERI